MQNMRKYWKIQGNLLDFSKVKGGPNWGLRTLGEAMDIN